MATEPKLKEFAEHILDGKTQRQAIKDTFPKQNYSDEYADVKGNRLIRNVKVQEYLESRAEKAAENVFELANEADNETVKLNANKDILDRAGFKPTEKQESKSINVNINISEAYLDKVSDQIDDEIDREEETDINSGNGTENPAVDETVSDKE